jgi:poly(A) polymerase
MNAVYADPDGTLFDPVGGAADARARLVRFIGDAEARIKEDYLRILRFFRFNAQYGRDIDEAGLAACARNKEGLNILSGERVQAELMKLLETRNPGPCLGLMKESGILALVLPEAIADRASALSSDDSPPQNDAEPRVRALRRLAVLLGPDEDRIRSAARRLRLSNEIKFRLSSMAKARDEIRPGMTDRDLQRSIYRLGIETYRDWVAVAGTSKELSRDDVERLARTTWVPPDFPLKGKDVVAAGMAPSPTVGKILGQLEAWWIDNEFKPTRDELLTRLKQVVGDHGKS